jgi:omega-6 fatty acid desaturase (delta-12 desaturase)
MGLGAPALAVASALFIHGPTYPRTDEARHAMQATTWNRKALLSAFEKSPSLLLPSLVLLFDIVLFVAGSALVLLPSSLALKLLGTCIVTAAIVRLFLIGHDACHGSFFNNQKLNAILGRIAFLPSMTAYSLWEVGHNTAHHGFNNLKGRDQVWAPFSKAEFDALPRLRQSLERLYRSGLGWGAYYLVEMWWKKLYFPSRKEIGSIRRKYTLDSLLVTITGLLWLAAVALTARATGQSYMLLFTLAVVVPFLLWNAIMGFIVYVHHTNPRIAWFRNRQEWQRDRAYLTSTACVRFPFGIDRLMHSIMEHNAHHLNPGIPMFKLRAAKRVLHERFPDLCEYRMNFQSYMDCVRRCKLYDFTNHAWLDFSGQVTARVALTSAAA